MGPTMSRPALLLLLALCAPSAAPQDAAFPLETIAVESSAISPTVIAELAGLRPGEPIDKRGIDLACDRLQRTGLFSSVSYRYAPGPNNGYALTLTLADQQPLAPAVIDVPGVAEDEVWQWLSARFPPFQRRAPQTEAGQQFLAAAIEKHLAPRLNGQRLVARVESNLITGKSTILFQPEKLPPIRSVSFSGNAAIPTTRLDAALAQFIADAGYAPRQFAAALEANLRPLYEEKGLYQASFTPTVHSSTGEAVALAVAIHEGSPYQLRNAEIVGEGLPVDRLLSAARLPTGKLANWTNIQTGLWAMESLIKAAGYLDTTVSAERSFDHAARLLDLRIRIRPGPLYRFGSVRVSGLSPVLEKRALLLWQPKPGDPYDPTYAHVFFQSFFQSVDARSFRKYDAETQKRPSENVIDVHLVFQGR